MKELRDFKKERPYFRLFACCGLVNGATRSVIVDTQRGHFDFIPNSLYTILMTYKNKSFNEIIALFDEADHITIIEYFNFLIDKDYLFWCTFDELSLFPDIDPRFETPSLIDNSIIDVNQNSNHHWDQLILQLLDLGCRALQIRFFCDISFDDLQKISSLIFKSSIKSFEIVLPYNKVEYSESNIKELFVSNIQISSLTFYGAPSSERVSTFDNLSKIYYIEELITGAHHCGFVHSNYFVVNTEHYFESLKHNSCLNKKLSIDENGNIKNCPASKASFGHVSNTSLRTALAHKEFKSLWDVSKDKVTVCKDCEFRYICTDCRVNISNEHDIYSKPKHCSYDPYTGKWADDVENLL
jgi:SPASM domain peptide maturase of grasp-with-spasm system